MKTYIESLKHLFALIEVTPGSADCRVHLLASILSAKAHLNELSEPEQHLQIADCSGEATIIVGCFSPIYRLLCDHGKTLRDTAVAFTGTWASPSRGALTAIALKLEPASEEEFARLMDGGPDFREKVKRNWDYLAGIFASEAEYLLEPWVRILERTCRMAMDQYGLAFCRAAAAHGNHHARRGGLLEHTVSMMRFATVMVCESTMDLRMYLQLEIVQAGILFHDFGKIFETDYEANSFRMRETRTAEMFGHIAAGSAYFLQAWAAALAEEPGLSDEEWEDVKRARDHVNHIILSHHGCLEWGSPVEPKTLEALLVHHIDNLDAKIEMMRQALGDSREYGEIVHPKRPLPKTIIRPF